MSYNDNVVQLQAWIWEAGIKLGFQDVSDRIESQLEDTDSLLQHFTEGRSLRLLLIVRKLQQILAEIDNKEEIAFASLDTLQCLIIELLSDKNFHNEIKFVTSLICLYQSTLIIICAKGGVVDNDQLSLFENSPDSVWEDIKKTLGFKTDFYKQDFIKVTKVSRSHQQTVRQKKLNSKNLLKNVNTLKRELRHLYAELVNLLTPPALIHICSKEETQKELKRLNVPSYNFLLQHIRGTNITAACLHSIIDNLPNYPLQASSSTQQSISIETEMKSPSASPTVENTEQTHMSNILNSKCNNVKTNKCDIVILNGIYWELKNLDFCEEKMIRSENVVSINKTASDQNQTNCNVILRSNENGSCRDTLTNDIDNLGKLTKSVRKLLLELEHKTQKLKERREIILKLKGKSFSLNNNGCDVELKEEREDVVLSFDLNTNECVSERSSLPEVSSCNDSMPNLSNEMEKEKNRKLKVTRSSFLATPSSSSSDNIMPKLTPNAKSNIDNLILPVVQLTPLNQSDLDKYKCGSSSDTTENQSNSRKWVRKSPLQLSSRKKKKDCSFDKESLPRMDTSENSLSRINLIVTNAHSTTENHAVILESSGPSTYHGEKEENGKIKSLQNSSRKKDKTRENNENEEGKINKRMESSENEDSRKKNKRRQSSENEDGKKRSKGKESSENEDGKKKNKRRESSENEDSQKKNKRKENNKTGKSEVDSQLSLLDFAIRSNRNKPNRNASPKKKNSLNVRLRKSAFQFQAKYKDETSESGMSEDNCLSLKFSPRNRSSNSSRVKKKKRPSSHGKVKMGKK